MLHNRTHILLLALLFLFTAITSRSCVSFVDCSTNSSINSTATSNTSDTFRLSSSFSTTTTTLVSSDTTATSTTTATTSAAATGGTATASPPLTGDSSSTTTTRPTAQLRYTTLATTIPPSIVRFELVFASSGAAANVPSEWNLTLALRSLLKDSKKMPSTDADQVIVRILNITSPNSAGGTTVKFICASVWTRGFDDERSYKAAEILLSLQSDDVAARFSAGLFGRAANDDAAGSVTGDNNPLVNSGEALRLSGAEVAIIVCSVLGGVSFLIAVVVLVGTRTKLAPPTSVVAADPNVADSVFALTPPAATDKELMGMHRLPGEDDDPGLLKLPRSYSVESSSSSLSLQQRYHHHHNPLLNDGNGRSPTRRSASGGSASGGGGGGLRALAQRNQRVGLAHRNQQQQESRRGLTRRNDTTRASPLKLSFGTAQKSAADGEAL